VTSDVLTKYSCGQPLAINDNEILVITISSGQLFKVPERGMSQLVGCL
jgi:hypothetical protein